MVPIWKKIPVETNNTQTKVVSFGVIGEFGESRKRKKPKQLGSKGARKAPNQVQKTRGQEFQFKAGKQPG